MQLTCFVDHSLLSLIKLGAAITDKFLCVFFLIHFMTSLFHCCWYSCLYTSWCSRSGCVGYRNVQCAQILR